MEIPLHEDGDYLAFDTPVQAAMWYAEKGFYVFPIWWIQDAGCACNDGGMCKKENPGKHPIPLHGLKEATADKKQIAKWWNKYPKANIGIRTGPESGIAVIDLDVRHGENGPENLMKLFEKYHGSEVTPDTCQQLTGSGGRHMIFRYPAEPIKNSKGGFTVEGVNYGGIDIRGENGYILAAPSFNDLGQYRWHDGPIQDFPAWLWTIIKGQAKADPKGEVNWYEINEQRYEETFELVKQHWPSGKPEHELAHHDFALAVSSIMLKAGIPKGLAERVILQCNDLVKSSDGQTHSVSDLQRCIRDAYESGTSANHQSLASQGISESVRLITKGIWRIWRVKGQPDGISNPEFVGDLCLADWFSDNEMKIELVVRDYLDNRHVIAEYNGLLHEFNGKYWLKDALGNIRSSLQKVDDKLQTKDLAEVVERIRNLKRVTDPDKVDLPMEEVLPLEPHVIPVRNGLLNLITKQLFVHSPLYYYTEFLPRNYVSGGKPEIFSNLLENMFRGDPSKDSKIAQVYETIAWTLMRNYTIHGAVIFFGQGGEGKSIIQAVMENLLGHVSSITLDDIEKDKFKRAELYGSWANLVSESSSRVIGSEWFKRTSDGSRILTDRKNGQPFSFRSHAKWIVMTNELPVKEKELRAFYRRVPVIIDFPNRLEDVLTPEEIDRVVSQLGKEEELDKIFSFVVDNYYGPLTTRLKFTGHLDIEEAEKMWTERSNPSVAFLKRKEEDAEIIEDPEDLRQTLLNVPGLTAGSYLSRDRDTGEEYVVTPKPELIRECQEWAQQSGFPSKKIDAKGMGHALTSLGYPNITTDKSIKKGVKVRAWRDVAVLPGFQVSQFIPYGLKEVGYQSEPTESDSEPTVSQMPSPIPGYTEQKLEKEKYKPDTRGQVGLMGYLPSEPINSGIAKVSHMEKTQVGYPPFKSLEIVWKALKDWGFEVTEYKKVVGTQGTWTADLQGSMDSFKSEAKEFLRSVFDVRFEGSNKAPFTVIRFEVESPYTEAGN